MTRYRRRIIDDELDELLGGIAAIALEGAKAVGKTATALQRARTVYRLDDPDQASVVRADSRRVVSGDAPILLDEWQQVPEVWDVVRRAVDEDPTPGRFLLTGSASPSSPPTHSGAGRIVRVRMRPLSLAERHLEEPTVSLGALLSGRRERIDGETAVDLERYTEEIVASGFPAIRPLAGRARRAQLEGYIARIVDRDFDEMGHTVRRPAQLRRWMASYAAATSTVATFEAIRDSATAGDAEKPTRPTVITYRDTLERLWINDPVPAWIPTRNVFSRLALPAKHQIVDPALAAALIGVEPDALLQGADGVPSIPRDGPLLGHLFESLLAQSVRVYARRAEARVSHLRTKGGRQEIDLIVERADRRVLAIEVKLGGKVTDSDVKHLLWLRRKIGEDLLDAVVVNTGRYAYRRSDDIAVVPAALLGP